MGGTLRSDSGMKKKKHKSGNQKRQERAEKEKGLKKLKEAAARFFVTKNQVNIQTVL